MRIRAPINVINYLLVLGNALKSQTKFEHLPQTQYRKKLIQPCFRIFWLIRSKAFAWKSESLTKSLLINKNDESFTKKNLISCIGQNFKIGLFTSRALAICPIKLDIVNYIKTRFSMYKFHHRHCDGALPDFGSPIAGKLTKCKLLPYQLKWRIVKNFFKQVVQSFVDKGVLVICIYALQTQQ